MFARVQLLLEETQGKMNKAEERSQNIERQLINFSQRVQALEGYIALMRAQSMQAVELAGKTHGDNGNPRD
jgi:hypothetical protein